MNLHESEMEIRTIHETYEGYSDLFCEENQHADISLKDVRKCPDCCEEVHKGFQIRFLLDVMSDVICLKSQLCEKIRNADISLKDARECPENFEEMEEDNKVPAHSKKNRLDHNRQWFTSYYERLRKFREWRLRNFENFSIYFSSFFSDNEHFGKCNCHKCKKVQIKERVAKTSPTSRLSSTLFSGLVFLSTPLICAGAASMCNFTSTEEGTYTNLNCYFTDDLSKSQQTVYVDFFQTGALNHPENLITCKWKDGNIFCKHQFHYSLIGNVTTHLSVKFSLQPRMGKYVCSLFGNDAKENKPCDLSAAGGGDSEDNISTNESTFSTDVNYVVGVCGLLFSCMIF